MTYLIASAFLCARFCFALVLATSLTGAVGPAGPGTGPSVVAANPAVAAAGPTSGTAVGAARVAEGMEWGLGGSAAADALAAGIGDEGAVAMPAEFPACSAGSDTVGCALEAAPVVMPFDRRTAAWFAAGMLGD